MVLTATVLQTDTTQHSAAPSSVSGSTAESDVHSVNGCGGLGGLAGVPGVGPDRPSVLTDEITIMVPPESACDMNAGVMSDSAESFRPATGPVSGDVTVTLTVIDASVDAGAAMLLSESDCDSVRVDGVTGVRCGG
jgi:hypothetical protein